MRRILLSVLLGCCFFVHCDGSKERIKISHRERIVKELSNLLLRSNEDPFVIFEDTKTKKFVQFAGSTREQLLLDLPSIALSPPELERAKKLFAEYGVKLEQIPFSNYKGGPITGIESGFIMKLGKDVENAAEITLRVFSEVYLLPSNFKLGVQVN
jgi:hypothetical protein